MEKLEKMKLKVELMRVETAKAELEYKVMDRMAEIARLEEAIKVQEEKISEIKQSLGEG